MRWLAVLWLAVLGLAYGYQADGLAFALIAEDITPQQAVYHVNAQVCRCAAMVLVFAPTPKEAK